MDVNDPEPESEIEASESTGSDREKGETNESPNSGSDTEDFDYLKDANAHNALVMFAVNACIGLEIVSRVEMKNFGYARMRTAAMRFVIITASNSALLMKIGT